MSSTRSFDTAKGGVTWSQDPNESSTLELRIPLQALSFNNKITTTPTELFRKNLDVTVEGEDNRILAITYTSTPSATEESEVNTSTPVKNVVVWRSQLYAPIKVDSLSWYVASKKVVVLELVKEVDNRWEELLCVPVTEEDGEHYLSRDELNEAAALLFPPIPTPSVSGDDENQVATAIPDVNLPQQIQEAQKRELLRYTTEQDACNARLAELNQQLTALKQNVEGKEVDPEQITHLEHSINLTEKLIETIVKIRTLRTSTPTTIDSILKYQQLEVLKGRVNIGENNMEEFEEYGSPEEEAMSGTELFLNAVAILRSQTAPSEAVRLLRIAATRKANAHAAITLLVIYKEAPMSFVRGATALLKIALDDTNGFDRRANHYIGNLFNDGTRFFPRNWAVAVHFYQRAASAGSAASMRCLWELLSTGECANHAPPGSEDTFEPSPHTFPSPLRAEYFLNASVERGNVAAFVIQAKQLAMGTEDVEPDVKGARAALDDARAAEPLIARSSDFRTVEAFVRSKEAAVAEIVSAVAASATLAAAVNDDDDIIEMPLPKKVPSTIRPTSSSPTPMSLASAKPSAADRLAKYCQEVGGVNVDDCQPDRRGGGGMMATTKGTRNLPRKQVGDGEKSKQFWERTAKVGVVFGAVYFFSFPIRALILPAFYDVVQKMLETFGFASSSSNSLF